MAKTKKFDRCVKSVRKTVKARKGSTKESAAIAICTTTLLHPRGRTLKKYRKGRLVTQKRKLRRGGEEAKPGVLSRLKEKATALAQTAKAKVGEKIQKIKSQFEPESITDKDYGFTLTDEEQYRRNAMAEGKDV